MTPRQWLALFVFYTIYLFFGASIFYNIEHEYEVERRAEELAQRIEINELLAHYTSPDDIEVQNFVLDSVTKYCGKPVTNHTLDKYVDPYLWDFYHSVFFAFTVCSTLGYGNIAPTHTFGQYFMIIYALIGIPVNGILYAYLGEFFGNTFVNAYNRYTVYKMDHDRNYVPKKWGLIAQITWYLVPAAVLLILLPSCLFTYFEGWPYSVSLYYSFVTLSTIGFGDYIPTFQPHQEREFGIAFKFYQAFVIIWFVFGLSYLLMIIGFIASGMQSKKFARLEQHLADNLKLTHNRIWSGMTKDVSYLRRIMNEVHMMKLKPIYIDPDHKASDDQRRRYDSCPDLTLYRTNSIPARKKRATSIHYDSHSRHSDTDLSKIDKKKTFFEPMEPIAARNTDSVLARVIQTLGHVGNIDNTASHNVGMGFFGFGSQLVTCQSFASDFSTHMTDVDYSTPPNKPRSRAVSEFKTNVGLLNEWNDMKKSCSENNNIIEDLNAFNRKNSSVTVNVDDLPKTKDSIQDTNKLSDEDQNYLEHLFKRRDSKVDFAPKQNRRMSQLPTIESSHEDILENTTLGDLIRAIAIAETHKELLGDIESNYKPISAVENRRTSLFPGRATNQNANKLSTRRQSAYPDMEKYLSKYNPPFGLMETPLERRLSARLPRPPPPTTTKAPNLLRRLSMRSNQGIKLNKKESTINEFAKRRASHAPGIISGGTHGRNITWKNAKQQALETRHSSMRDLKCKNDPNLKDKNEIFE